MKTWAKVAIGVGVAAAVVTGLGVAEHYAHASSSGPCSVPATFTQGHRYKVVLANPTPNAIPVPTTAQAQAALAQLQSQVAGLAGVSIAEVDAPPPGQGGFTAIVDVTGASFASTDFCSQFAANAPAGSTIAVQDMGATPAGG